MINSYLSPKCEVKMKDAIHRYGVFAKEDITQGELLTIWGGCVITREQMNNMPKDIQYPIQVYDDLYFGPTKKEEIDDAEMFNHSCMPNAGVKGSIILVARRDIQKGEEICFDYETTDTEEMDFLCSCGTKACRKIINGKAWMNKEFQEKNKGYFSWYLEEKIEKMHKSHWFFKKPRFLKRITA